MAETKKNTYQVDRKTTAGEFLRGRAPTRPEYPQFKVKILLDNGAVQLYRDRKYTPVTKASDVLEPPAILKIDETKCGDKLTRIPAERFVDYAFVPRVEGGNRYLDGMRSLLTARPQTRIPERATPMGLVDLHLSDLEDPIRDLIFVSHGDPQGQLELPIEVSVPKVLDFEYIQVLEQGDSLRVDKPSMALPRPPVPDGPNGKAPGAPLTVRFRGCVIGAIPPYLEAPRPPSLPPHLVHLKKAFGVERLVAPKFVHVVGEVPGGRGGWFEYLSYGFVLLLPDAAANLGDLTDAFIARGGLHFDGKTRISAERWRRWLRPANPRERLPEPRYGNNGLEFALQAVTADVPGTAIEARLSTKLVMLKQRLFKDWSSFPAAQAPVDRAAEVRLVRDGLAREPGFEANHEYPMWGRLGYLSLDDMMQRMHWEFVWDDDKLAFDAWHYLYLLEVPIFDDAGLIGNYYPRAGRPTIRLTEDDPRFFTTV